VSLSSITSQSWYRRDGLAWVRLAG